MTRLLRLAALVIFLPSITSAQETWTNRTGILASNSPTPKAAVYAGGRYFLVGTSFVYHHSGTGTSGWTRSNFTNADSSDQSTGAAAGGGRVVVTGRYNVAYTTSEAAIAAYPGSAIEWTRLNPALRPGAFPDLYRVRYLNGQFVAGIKGDTTNTYSEILSSPDGITWASHQFIASSLANRTFDTVDMAFKPGASAGQGTWVIVTTATNALLTATENFSSATKVDLSGLGSSQSVVFAEGLFVVATNGGKIFTSATGAAASWTQRTLPAGITKLNDVFHDGTDFVSVGATVSGSSPARPAILVSADGVTWAEASTVPTGSSALNTLLRADGLWLAAGDSGSIYTSGSGSAVIPQISGGPGSSFLGPVGGSAEFSFTVTGSPAPTFQWLKDNVVVGNGATAQGSTITGADTATLNIANLRSGDRGTYVLRATNSAGVVDSGPISLNLSFSAGGAILTPYGRTFTEGGKIVEGASPAKAVIGGITGSTFSPGVGIVQLPGVTNGGANYRFFGGINPSGTKMALYDTNDIGPSIIYDLTTNTSTGLPPVTLPIGPINTVTKKSATDVADNGDFTGSIEDGSGVRHGYHYSAASGTYTLLGNVPNTPNDPSTNPEAISADGTSIAGYERVNDFNGAFLWTTGGGFTLLEAPANASTPDGDIRAISSNGRFIVGLGKDSVARGGGATAMRWDRGAALGFPTGLGLDHPNDSTFSDAFTVNDSGITGGFYRRPGGQNTDSRAAIWLADGSLRDLNDYLLTRYGLDTGGFHLSLVTSISEDGRTLAGNSTSTGFIPEGWILTLPDPIHDGASGPPTAAQIALESYLDGFNVPIDMRNPSDDPDGDGVSNLMEFALGLSPVNHSVLPVAELSGNTVSITYVRANPQHVDYAVTFSTDLGISSPFAQDSVNQGSPAPDGTTTASISTTGKTKGFLRVAASLKP